MYNVFLSEWLKHRRYKADKRQTLHTETTTETVKELRAAVTHKEMWLSEPEQLRERHNMDGWDADAAFTRTKETCQHLCASQGVSDDMRLVRNGERLQVCSAEQTMMDGSLE